MAIEKRLLAIIASSCGLNEEGASEEAIGSYLAEELKEFSHKVTLPQSGESLAISLLTPKIAALAHDRVLQLYPLAFGMPKEIVAYCGTLFEEFFYYGSLLTHIAERRKVLPPPPLMEDHDIQLRAGFALRSISSEIYNTFGLNSTIYYDTRADYTADYPSGPQQVLTTALENIAMVEESSLSWEQVLEFRQDIESRAKYRRLVRWIDNELKTKSPSEILDIIAIRLDDYQWGLKKHGVKTVLGSLSCVLDPKFLASAAAVVGASTLAGGELWAALSTTTLTVGRAALSFGKSYIDSLDERRKDNYEVAYIHDIKKAAK